MISLCNPSCPGTCSIDETGLDIRDPHASGSWVLGWKAFTTSCVLSFHSQEKCPRTFLLNSLSTRLLLRMLVLWIYISNFSPGLPRTNLEPCLDPSYIRRNYKSWKTYWLGWQVLHPTCAECIRQFHTWLFDHGCCNPRHEIAVLPVTSRGRYQGIAQFSDTFFPVQTDFHLCLCSPWASSEDPALPSWLLPLSENTSAWGPWRAPSSWRLSKGKTRLPLGNHSGKGQRWPRKIRGNMGSPYPKF